MEAVWRGTLPLTQLSGYRGPGCHTWGRTIPRLLVMEGPARRNEAERWLTTKTPVALTGLPDLFRRLAEVEWRGEWIRRDTIDLARSLLDIGLWHAYERMMRTYHRSRTGAADEQSVRREAARCRELVRVFAGVLALHTDYSVAESLDRLDRVEKIRNPEFEKVLFENSACDYCLSHQAEYATGVYVPMTDDMADAICAQAGRRDVAELPRPRDRRQDMRASSHPLRDFAPVAVMRTAARYGELMSRAAVLTEGLR